MNGTAAPDKVFALVPGLVTPQRIHPLDEAGRPGLGTDRQANDGGKGRVAQAAPEMQVAEEEAQNEQAGNAGDEPAYGSHQSDEGVETVDVIGHQRPAGNGALGCTAEVKRRHQQGLQEQNRTTWRDTAKTRNERAMRAARSAGTRRGTMATLNSQADAP
jgi:hypothetical protein